MTILLAQPKWAFTCCPSSVAKAIFIFPPDNSKHSLRQLRSSQVARFAMRLHPRLRRCLMHAGYKQIAYVEDQIACSSISNRHLVPSAEAIEDGNPNPEVRNVKTFRRLPPMRMSHDEVRSGRAE